MINTLIVIGVVGFAMLVLGLNFYFSFKTYKKGGTEVMSKIVSIVNMVLLVWAFGCLAYVIFTQAMHIM